MNRLHPATLFALSAAVLLSPAARAEDRRPVAAHPLVFLTPDDERHAQELAAVYAEAISEQAVPVVASEKTAAFLENVSGHSCGDVPEVRECLRNLARATGASGALLVRVSMWPVAVSGQLVNSEGNAVTLPMRQPSTPKSEAEKIALAKRTLREFVRDLLSADSSELVAPLSPAPSTAPASTSSVNATSTATATVEPVSSRREWQRPAAIAATAAGVLALGGATAFHLGANSKNEEAADFERGKVLSGESVTRLRELREGARKDALTRDVLGGIGLAALATGVGLFVLPDSNTTQPASVSFVVGRTSGVLISGSLP